MCDQVDFCLCILKYLLPVTLEFILKIKESSTRSTKSKKFEISLKAVADDLHQSKIFSLDQLLAFISSFNKFIKNHLHQPQSK